MKVIAAGLAAFIILNLFCAFYYNLAIHESSKTNATDYIWEKNKFYSRGTEGFALGVTDENGFNNLQTFGEGEIDVLFMGSSHMEGFNVAQDKNTVAVLNQMFQSSGRDLHAYNIGISGHTLVRCLNNLDAAINEFNPQKHVIIETSSLTPSIDDIRKTLSGDLAPMASHNDGIVGQLQRFPYLRLLYAQLQKVGAANEADEEPEQQSEDINQNYAEDAQYQQLLFDLINKSLQTCASAGIELIIFYNCDIDFDEQGKVLERTDTEDVENFRAICEESGVIFVDMYDAFKENYIKTNKLHRGFSSSKVGSGHINEEGHRIIAEELFSLICK